MRWWGGEVVCTAGRISCAELWRAALPHGTAAAQHTWEHSYSSRNCVTAATDCTSVQQPGLPPAPRQPGRHPASLHRHHDVDHTTAAVRSLCLPPPDCPPARPPPPPRTLSPQFPPQCSDAAWPAQQRPAPQLSLTARSVLTSISNILTASLEVFPVPAHSPPLPGRAPPPLQRDSKPDCCAGLWFCCEAASTSRLDFNMTRVVSCVFRLVTQCWLPGPATNKFPLPSC